MSYLLIYEARKHVIAFINNIARYVSHLKSFCWNHPIF